MRKISNFLESKFKIVLPIMPTSVVLSSRKKNTEPLKYKDNNLIIGDDAVLYAVDGQHRLFGAKQLKDNSYELPVTIVNGLDEHQEAAQFLVINSTQKKVEPSLQLRVLFYADKKLMETLIEEIKNVIPWQSWKLAALKIAIELTLENDPDNPWYKLVKQPNDPSDDWKPIKEGSFVDSFRRMTSEDNPVSEMESDKKVAHLKEYWNVIRKLWSRPFDQKEMSDYILVAPFGAGVFNTLFPSAMALKSVTKQSLEELLTPIANTYPVKSWRRKGELSRSGSSQQAYKETAEDFIWKIFPKLDYLDEVTYDKIREKFYNLRWLVDEAYNALSPLHLKSADYLKTEKGKFKRACYVLVDLDEDGDAGIYVGQTKTVESRLGAHNKKFNLYHIEKCEKDEEMKQLEAALYHLVKKTVRENTNHPNADFCPFC